MAGVWSIALGFGEIPVLANSAKVSVSAGYHFNNYVYLGRDCPVPRCHRARQRIVQCAEPRARRSSGHSGANRRPRASAHTSAATSLQSVSLRVCSSTGPTVKRCTSTGWSLSRADPGPVNPAVGLGYEVTFRPGITVSLELTGAFFLKPRKPAVNVVSKGMDEARRAAIAQSAEDSFGRNFHNRYHLFNMAVGMLGEHRRRRAFRKMHP